MTGLEYVHHRLHQDFGASRSQTIITLLDQYMEELTTPTELEDGVNADFQNLLADSVYPFLACLNAMIDAGVDIHIANRYCKRIAEEMPEELKQSFAERELRLW